MSVVQSGGVPVTYSCAIGGENGSSFFQGYIKRSVVAQPSAGFRANGEGNLGEVGGPCRPEGNTLPRKPD
jgi:hypothetical protein